MPPSTSSPYQHKSPRPFVSANHRPADNAPDGIFRVVLISSGSVASIKVPDIAGALLKNKNIALQIVATKASTHFFSQTDIDSSICSSISVPPSDSSPDIGVRVWTDEDEWADWKKVGEPILHIELRRWADLVVIAPCSADMLAKIAGAICDNLATSLLRALSPSTPVVLCPAMNTHMYQHPFTAKHLSTVTQELGYLVSGPQGAGRLACGDDGPGKMTDWNDIVLTIEGFASMFHKQYHLHLSSATSNWTTSTPSVVPSTSQEPLLPQNEAKVQEKKEESAGMKDWREQCGIHGEDGSFWNKMWWTGV
ncbi:hypothetical protein L198_02141 [Cryptococcus wingfieldii CBS 7118]|uniref:Flavoprotein domain-containing protein n=1 Tax=Cryptococcus wingfieldii CBS 7118 TaxID=1295528 RepID=A0A1E3JX51_9TREE|nr:hypothetical protein L198_02141 [Cryptococcus wingfieldii CBS 7118]ODO05448.1 hypothetical protein L198_02141 [Cryptococcus wingfieldii CBS 7118]